MQMTENPVINLIAMMREVNQLAQAQKAKPQIKPREYFPKIRSRKMIDISNLTSASLKK